MANTNSNRQDPLPGQLRTLNLIYWVMAVVQIAFGVAVYALTAMGTLGKPNYDLAIIFQKIMIFLVPLSMAAGYFIFRYLLSRLDKKLSLDEKVKRYMAFIMIRSGLFEAGFFYCCIAAFLTGVQLFLWISPIIFLVFLLLRPTPEGIAADLELTPADRNRLIAQ